MFLVYGFKFYPFKTSQLESESETLQSMKLRADTGTDLVAGKEAAGPFIVY